MMLASGILVTLTGVMFTSPFLLDEENRMVQRTVVFTVIGVIGVTVVYWLGNIELANHRLRRSATTARLRNNNASANALHCFKTCGCAISLLSFVLAIFVGVCGILNKKKKL